MSWSIFYLEMQAHMVRQTIRHYAPPKPGKLLSFAGGKVFESIVDLKAFADAFCDAYDKTVKTGKTLIGGVPVGSGNKKIMKVVLIAKMMQAKNSGKKLDKTLLDLCGTAVQAYWAFAGIAKSPVPTMPCIGSVKNITTTQAYALYPGKWTSIIVGPQNSFDPFLLSFIASAMLHNLTLSGIFICNCQYPPPAPPAVGVLPWVGYYVAPPGTGGSGLGVKALVKSSINSKITELKQMKNLYGNVANLASKYGKTLLALTAGVAGLYIANKLYPRKDKKQLHKFLQTKQGKLELAQLQKEGISSKLANEIAVETFINNVPTYDDVASKFDNSELNKSPKTISQQIKDGDIKDKVNKITNITKKDVINNNTLQKNIAQTFKTPTSGNITNIVPKSIPSAKALIVKESYVNAYDKIKNSGLSNLQKMDLLDNTTKNLAAGVPTENIDALIKQKENDKTKG